MPQRFDLLIFDWDGTLADSTPLIVRSIQESSREAGLPIPTDADANQIIGMSLRPAIEKLFGDAPEDKILAVMRRYQQLYHASSDDIALFDGVYEALHDLNARGYALAVATGKGRRGLNDALALSGTTHLFAASRCADECHSKPHPQMLDEIVDDLMVTHDRTLMIGDTSHDLQMAANAGVASLGVSYGAHPLENLLPHAPLAHFDCFTNVYQWLIMNA